MLTDESLPFHLYRIATTITRRDYLYTYIQTNYEAATADFPGFIPWLMLLRRIGYQNLSEFSRKYKSAKEQPNYNNENNEKSLALPTVCNKNYENLMNNKIRNFTVWIAKRYVKTYDPE